ncbi:MAG: hypothetical protein AAF196_03215 [Planctomycetota bacterium]
MDALPGPATIAVLPFEGDAASLEQRDVIRRMLDAFLQGRGVLTSDLDWLDHQITIQGLDPAEDDWLSDPTALHAPLNPKGLRYILRGSEFELAGANAGVAFIDRVVGRLQLYDLQERKIVWDNRASSLEYGGVLIETSQIVTGVRQSFDRDTNGQQLRLGIAFCQDALEEWPGFGGLDQLVRTSAPSATATRMLSVDAADGTPARVTVEVIASGGCTARLLLVDGRFHPMLEVEPNRYRAHFETIGEEELLEAELVMTDQWGLQLRGPLSSWLESPTDADGDAEGTP